MQRSKQKKLILLTVGVYTLLAFFTSNAYASSFGAQIFCTMRDGGNDHESSWEAAYSYIKRQKGGFFKTSPKQAAAQIIETVVREKDKFSGCVEYLDKLYPDRELQRKLEKEEKEEKIEAIKKENRIKKIEDLLEEDKSISEESFDRYDY